MNFMIVSCQISEPKIWDTVNLYIVTIQSTAIPDENSVIPGNSSGNSSGGGFPGIPGNSQTGITGGPD